MESFYRCSPHLSVLSLASTCTLFGLNCLDSQKSLFPTTISVSPQELFAGGRSTAGIAKSSKAPFWTLHLPETGLFLASTSYKFRIDFQGPRLHVLGTLAGQECWYLVEELAYSWQWSAHPAFASPLRLGSTSEDFLQWRCMGSDLYYSRPNSLALEDCCS